MYNTYVCIRIYIYIYIRYNSDLSVRLILPTPVSRLSLRQIDTRNRGGALSYTPPFRCHRLVRYCWLTAATRVLTLGDVGSSMLKANLHESLLTDDGLDQSEERSRVESDNFSVKSIFVTGKRRISTIISDNNDDSSKTHKYFSLPPSHFLSLSKITLEILQLPILFAMPSRSL